MADILARSEAAASTAFPTCYRGGQAATGTFNVVSIELTETITWADWEYPGDGSLQSLGAARCWAIPATLLATV